MIQTDLRSLILVQITLKERTLKVPVSLIFVYNWLPFQSALKRNKYKDQRFFFLVFYPFIDQACSFKTAEC